MSRRWSDEEVGFLIDTMSRPVQEVANELGRTYRAVECERVRVRRGKAAIAPWSEDELSLLRETPHLTIRQHAEMLGRSYSTVVGVRQRLARKEGIQWGGYNKDPHSIGRRPLLAKTCHGCGLLLDANWFVLRRTGVGAGLRFSRCIRCCNPDTDEYRRKQADDMAKRREAGAAKNDDRLQRLSKQWATRGWQPYVGADHQILSDPDLTDVEKAYRLQRTLSATRASRRRFGYTSKVGRGDPMKGRWVIDNPNVEAKVLAAGVV